MSRFMEIAKNTTAKFLDLGQRLFSLFLANALPAVTGGAVIGVSVAKSALLAGFMATDGELTSEEIAEAFGKKA